MHRTAKEVVAFNHDSRTQTLLGSSAISAMTGRSHPPPRPTPPELSTAVSRAVMRILSWRKYQTVQGTASTAFNGRCFES